MQIIAESVKEREFILLAVLIEIPQAYYYSPTMAS
jgi:hypothetical protein